MNDSIINLVLTYHWFDEIESGRKTHKCRIERTDSAIHLGFDFLEDVALKSWNERNYKEQTK